MDTPGLEADTVRRVTAALQAARARIDELERRPREPIAIIGMACRMPGGANDPDLLWSLIESGGDAITPIPEHRLALVRALGDTGFDDLSLRNVHGAFVEGVEEFEPAFFGISEREATRMDPQQRMMLEVVWQALENASIKPADVRGTRTGLYAGICFEDFAHRGLYAHEVDVALSVGSSRSIGVGRVAYTLDLKGPVLQLDTTCSSSLLAVHLAAHALRRGECDLALAGGVNVMLSHEIYLAFTRMGALSRSGQCRTFDAGADGYVRGEGCGFVVLKPLRAAVADGDHIWAVVEGSAVNHDGRSNGLTAPNGSAQEAVIREALEHAGVAASDVQYLEAHGTGTPLGDPIEVSAAARALCASRPAHRPLHLGSIKSNVGHLEGGAGVAGLMKVALALHHRRIPPQANFSEPSERIAWDAALCVPTETIDWPETPDEGGPHAGVSCFGMSGTNVHVVVGAAPARVAPTATRVPAGHVLVVTARTEASLRALSERYAEALERPRGPSIADLCFTANTSRQRFDERAVFVADDAPALAGALRDFARGGFPDASIPDGPADASAHYDGCAVRRVPLPPYAFDRKRLWLGEIPTSLARAPSAAVSSGSASAPPAPDPAPDDIRALLLTAIAEAIDRPAGQIADDALLAELDIDSLAAADVLLTMERELGRPLADGLMTQATTIVDLANIIEELPPPKAPSSPKKQTSS